MSDKPTVLRKLRENYESVSEIAGTRWGCVYIDNARPQGMSVHQFRAILAQLSKEGLYRPVDHECFGDVRLDY